MKPALTIVLALVSPLARKGVVDKTAYDAASILRFVTRRWNLEPLTGVVMRDRALVGHGRPSMGDLTAALERPR